MVLTEEHEDVILKVAKEDVLDFETELCVKELGKTVSQSVPH